MSSTAKANAVLVAAVIFLLLSSCAAYLALKRLQTSQQWVMHTLNVQHALDHFSTMAGRAGRLRSEYVDSGDPSLLTRQNEAAAEVRAAVSAIRQLTADNLAQQANCERLTALTEQRLALMDQALELKRSGKSTPEIQVPINREMMAAADATENVVRTMEDEEQHLLTEREKREGSSLEVIGGVLLTSMFLALIFFLVHHQMITDQVHERMRAETAQRNLSARLLTLQDEERRKFARELHDSVGQQLAAMKMAISMIERRLPGDAVVVDCLKLLDDAIAETRTISHLLHPPLLDDAGLHSAMRWFVEGFAKRSGIHVNLHIQDGVLRYDDTVELALFRALQEGLTNVHRHSGAKQADVSLTTAGDKVILTVRDHGCGIPQAMLHGIKADGTAGGVGLAGMTERLREIGGRLEINSTASGTEIIAQVPVRRRATPPPEILNAPAQEVNG
jgi:two-component system, NarL family, sensor kinase